TLLAAWRSRARMTSRPRSVPPCASFKTTRKKSPPSTKSHRSDMPLECLVIYVLINTHTTGRMTRLQTEGYWRRILTDSYGRDREGNQSQGRTWVKATNKWRARRDQPRTVYIKSSVAAAKIQVSDYLEAVQRADADKKPSSEQIGVLYVMRCLAMQEEVYKVGWTSNSAEQRARELSSATGVPVSFAVVDAW